MNLQWSGSEIVQLIAIFRIKNLDQLTETTIMTIMCGIEHHRLKISNIFA